MFCINTEGVIPSPLPSDCSSGQELEAAVVLSPWQRCSCRARMDSTPWTGRVIMSLLSQSAQEQDPAGSGGPWVCDL